MKPTPIIETITLEDGREITIETGVLAKQAHGSVVVRMGGTMILATVVSNYEANDGIDFLPLTVDYREKFAAGGKIPGGFFKREARPSDHEILIMRIVDRVLRPLFPKDYHAEVQLMLQLISHDPEIEPDSLVGLAASAAISISDIPFHGPISEVRVGRVNGELIVNPTKSQLAESDIDMIVGASAESVVMVEGEMEEVSEQEMLQAISKAHEAIKVQCEAQLKLAAQVERSKVKREYAHEVNDDDFKQRVEDACYQQVYDIAKSGLDKGARSDAFRAVKEEFKASLSEEELETLGGLVGKYFHDVEKKAVRDLILNEGIRLDGRKTDEIRSIWCEVDYLPGAHGSAVFTRGETQSPTTVTLGTKLDENRIDGVTFAGSERFYLHYNFPPFSTGEARPIRGTSRREIGHGNLAQRALKMMIPDENPYVTRVVSDILESNGSSSMATVCAGTLALMDAGIKLKKPVSGIAMGLITEGGDSNKFAVLSDILGDEDHLGDMDFKVTGTKDGITACQMDIKVNGLSYEILEQALLQAKAGREHIMNVMMETMDAPRTQLKPNAPKIEIVEVGKEFIGGIIGPGGSIIQKMQAETGTTITIEEVDEIGIVEILGHDYDGIEEAKRRIAQLTFKPVVGEEYEGKVVTIQPYGAFIEIGPKTQGLLHISEIEWRRLDKVEEVLEEGQTIRVKLLDMDRQGKMKLSRKVLLPRPPRPEKNDEE